MEDVREVMGELHYHIVQKIQVLIEAWDVVPDFAK